MIRRSEESHRERDQRLLDQERTDLTANLPSSVHRAILIAVTRIWWRRGGTNEAGESRLARGCFEGVEVLLKLRDCNDGERIGDNCTGANAITIALGRDLG